MASATLFSPLNHSHQSDQQSYLDFDSSTSSPLPNSIRHWSYREVSNFVVKLLCLPRQLELDIRCFIVTREIDGNKLLSLDEVQLKRLGFNKKWCHTLSVAIRDLNRSVTPTTSSSPLDFTEHDLHHLTTSPTSRHVTTEDIPSHYPVTLLVEGEEVNSPFHDAIKTAQHYFTRSNLPTTTTTSPLFDITSSLQGDDDNVVEGKGETVNPPTPWSNFNYTLNLSVLAAFSIFIYKSCQRK